MQSQTIPTANSSIRRTQLLQAVINNDVTEVTQLLQADAKFHLSVEESRTCLEEAVKNKNPEIFWQLLAISNEKTNTQNIINLITEYRCEEYIFSALPNKLNIKEVRQLVALLLDAVYHNQEKIVCAILNRIPKGYPVKMEFFYIKTKNNHLHLAVLKNNPQMLKILVEHQIFSYSKNKAGFTPLMLAERKKYLDCIKVLISSLTIDNIYDDLNALIKNNNLASANELLKYINEKNLILELFKRALKEYRDVTNKNRFFKALIPYLQADKIQDCISKIYWAYGSIKYSLLSAAIEENNPALVQALMATEIKRMVQITLINKACLLNNWEIVFILFKNIKFEEQLEAGKEILIHAFNANQFEIILKMLVIFSTNGISFHQIRLDDEQMSFLELAEVEASKNHNPLLIKLINGLKNAGENIIDQLIVYKQMQTAIGDVKITIMQLIQESNSDDKESLMCIPIEIRIKFAEQIAKDNGLYYEPTFKKRIVRTTNIESTNFNLHNIFICLAEQFCENEKKGYIPSFFSKAVDKFIINQLRKILTSKETLREKVNLLKQALSNYEKERGYKYPYTLSRLMCYGLIEKAYIPTVDDISCEFYLLEDTEENRRENVEPTIMSDDILTTESSADLLTLTANSDGENMTPSINQ